MFENSKIIQELYDSFSQGRLDAVLELLDPKVEWIEAAGFPYAGTYTGPDEVRTNVIERVDHDWENYEAVPDEFIDAGENIVVLGFVGGTNRSTGKSFRARFAHMWILRQGKICFFEQIVDSAKAIQALP
jgi:ketosteroid isomerase-like protein